MNGHVEFISDNPTTSLPTDLHRDGHRLRAAYLDGETARFESPAEFLSHHEIDLSRQSLDTLAAFAAFLGVDWRPTHALELRLPGTRPADAPDRTEVVMFVADGRGGGGSGYTLDEYLLQMPASWTRNGGAWRHEGHTFPGGGNGSVTAREVRPSTHENGPRVGTADGEAHAEARAAGRGLGSEYLQRTRDPTMPEVVALESFEDFSAWHKIRDPRRKRATGHPTWRAFVDGVREAGVTIKG